MNVHVIICFLFDFLNIKSVKIYAIPYIISTTLLWYKLDTLLLKQKNMPVLDITGFFFLIRTQVTALICHNLYAFLHCLNFMRICLYIISLLSTTFGCQHSLLGLLVVSILEQNKFGYYGFLLPYSYSGNCLGATHLGLPC
jgi:hypothetical protein